MSPRAAVILLLFAGACRSPEANVYNLREVRNPDGSVKRIGAPMNRMEFFLRRGLLPSLGAGNVDLDLGTSKGPELIEDPDAIALENLLQLADCDSDDPWVLGLQVEIASWLAVDDEYRLARERAVIELGRLARRLGVTQPEHLRPDLEAAGPDDLAGPLADLVRAMRPTIQQGLEPGPDLDEACAAMAALAMDREAARRVVAVTNALLERGGRARPSLAPVRDLFERATRRSIALGLGDALSDLDPFVRAAAVDAVLRASSDRMIELRMQALSDPEPEVVVRVLDGITERGITVPEELDEARRADVRDAFVGRLIELSTDLRGPISAAACRALAAVTDSGLSTYRWEEWVRWWEGEVVARRDAPAADASLGQSPK